MTTSTSKSAPHDRQLALTQAIIDAGGVLRTAPEGAVAFRSQGLSRAFLLAKSGRLSVQFRTKDRRVPWAECRAAGGQDCMPVTAAILSGRAIPVRAVCMTPATWIESSPMALVLLVHVQPDCRHALFGGQAKRLATFFARISSKNALGLDQRIADWLLRHARANEVRATHTDIAFDLLTAREVVSRQLEKFASKGWIAQQRGCLLIEAPAALSRVSRGVFSTYRPARISP